MSDELIQLRQKNSAFEETIRGLEIYLSHHQAKITEAEHRVSDSEDALAQARNELGVCQSESIRFKRANDDITDEISREASAKGKLQEDKLKLENEILNLKIFNQKLQSEK